jgi:hypothetical protein
MADLHTFQFTVAHALGFSVSTSRLLATDLHTQTVTSNHYRYYSWNLPVTLYILTGRPLVFFCTPGFNSLRRLTVNADVLQDNSSARTPWKTVALLLRVCLPSRCIAMVTARTTQKTSYVIPSQRLHWLSDCCLETSNNIRISIVTFVYLVVRC